MRQAFARAQRMVEGIKEYPPSFPPIPALGCTPSTLPIAHVQPSHSLTLFRWEMPALETPALTGRLNVDASFQLLRLRSCLLPSDLYMGAVCRPWSLDLVKMGRSGSRSNSHHHRWHGTQHCSTPQPMPLWGTSYPASIAMSIHCPHSLQTLQ